MKIVRIHLTHTHTTNLKSFKPKDMLNGFECILAISSLIFIRKSLAWSKVSYSKFGLLWNPLSLYRNCCKNEQNMGSILGRVFIFDRCSCILSKTWKFAKFHLAALPKNDWIVQFWCHDGSFCSDSQLPWLRILNFWNTLEYWSDIIFYIFGVAEHESDIRIVQFSYY